MKKLIIILFALVLSFITTQAIAQHEKKSKWDLAFSYGLAAPVGSFGKIVPEETVIAFNESTSYFMFVKEGHGAAKNGQYFSFNLNYHFTKHWLMSFAANQSKNTIHTQQVLDYAIAFFDPYYSSIISNDYRVSSFAVGIGYQYDVKKISLRLNPIIGRAVLSSPDYSVSQRQGDDSWWFDVIDQENSVLWGFNSCINYQVNSKFYIGLKMDYHSANFNYSVRMKSAGYDPFYRTDMVNYRLLETGLAIGIWL